jgi:hypothetical protein
MYDKAMQGGLSAPLTASNEVWIEMIFSPDSSEEGGVAGKSVRIRICSRELRQFEHSRMKSL